MGGRVCGKSSLPGSSWRPDLAILSTAEFEGNWITIRNIRNARYRTEDDLRCPDITTWDFDLNDVQTVDFYPGSFQNAPFACAYHAQLRSARRPALCHIGGSAIGTRRIVLGPWRFGSRIRTDYLIADERDVISTSNRCTASRRFIFIRDARPPTRFRISDGYARTRQQTCRASQVSTTPSTTIARPTLSHMSNQLRPGRYPAIGRVLLPGHSDSLAYDLGLLDIPGSFEVAKATSLVNTLVALYRDDPDFSLDYDGSSCRGS